MVGSMADADPMEQVGWGGLMQLTPPIFDTVLFLNWKNVARPKYGKKLLTSIFCLCVIETVSY